MVQLHIIHWLRGGGGGVYWKLTSCQFNTDSANTTVHKVWAWKLLGRPPIWCEYLSMLKVWRHNEPELSFVSFCFTWVCKYILCMLIYVTVNCPFLFEERSREMDPSCRRSSNRAVNSFLAALLLSDACSLCLWKFKLHTVHADGSSLLYLYDWRWRLEVDEQTLTLTLYLEENKHLSPLMTF